jgi:FtsP/CotA-like multicopper oxidase with cupredoxin domain
MRVAFVADNPGKWMLHCHMLEHQAAGMMTWINVEI